MTNYEGMEGQVPSDALEAVEKPCGLPRIEKGALIDPDEVADGERRGKKRSMENGGDDVNDIRETKKPRVGTRRSTRRIANET